MSPTSTSLLPIAISANPRHLLDCTFCAFVCMCLFVRLQLAVIHQVLLCAQQGDRCWGRDTVSGLVNPSVGRVQSPASLTPIANVVGIRGQSASILPGIHYRDAGCRQLKSVGAGRAGQSPKAIRMLVN